jgi:transposase-like protein
LAQHFLLSAKARTLSVMQIARLSDDDAYAMFRSVRFAENGGEPFCPHCGVDAVYEFKTRRIFKCKACEKQFSLTSGTTFASRKLSYRDILAAIALFANGVNGHAALRLGRDLNVSYKTAFVLLHKLRRAMGTMQVENTLTGEVDVDGLYVGGYVRPANVKAERPAGPRPSGKKQKTIVTARERRAGGRSQAFVVKTEKAGVPHVLRVVVPSADVFTDEGAAFGKFYRQFANHRTVNHSISLVNEEGIHTNPLEGQHARIRRGERGVYLSISGAHAQRYAHEFCWRDDYRRVSNGQQFRTLLRRAATLRQDGELVGYWQKRPAPVMRLKRRRELVVLTRRRRARRAASTSASPPAI